MGCDVCLCDEDVETCKMEGISIVSVVFIFTFRTRLGEYRVRCSRYVFFLIYGSLFLAHMGLFALSSFTFI